MTRSLFDELRSRFEPPPEPVKIIPNAFAEVTRFAWRNAPAVILGWIALACIGIVASVLLFRSPSLEPASLPSGHTVSSATGLASLEDLQTIRLAAKDPVKLRDEQSELVAKLKSHDTVFSLVFSPGIGDFYDDRDLLYRSLDEVKGRVAYALSLKPLFAAFAEKPTAESMATLVTEIAGSVSAGRDPQGLNDLLSESANSVQALTVGDDKPVDWAKLADLEVVDSAANASIILLPKPGKESEARNLSLHMLDEFRHSTDTTATFTGAPRSAPVKSNTPFDGLRFASGLAIGLLFAGFLLALGFARISLILAILAPVLVLAPVFAAVQFVSFSSGWLAYWPLWLSALLLTGQVSLHVVMALVTKSIQRAREASLMMTAQHEGKSAVLLALLCAAPWIALVIFRSGDTVLSAGLAVVFAVLSTACALTLPAAIFRLAPRGVQWRAAQWFVPAHRVLFETGRWQLLSRIFALLLVVVSCAAIMALPTKPHDAPRDVAVTVMAENKTQVETTMTRLQSFSRAKGVRWLGTFLPTQGSEKVEALKDLKDQFPRIQPVRLASPDAVPDIKDEIDTLQDSLKSIADASTAQPGLKASADAFRRSLAILAATGNAQEIAQLENRLFGGFNRLADRADALAALEPPDLAGLPDELHQIFGKAEGPFTLEVTPADGVSNADLAIDLENAGFDVRHPAAIEQVDARAQTTAVMWVLGGGVLLILFILAYAFDDMRSAMIALAIIIAAALAMGALERFWSHDWNLTWLLVLVAVLSQLAASVYLSPADKGSSARMAMEVFLAPVLMVTLAVPLTLLNAGGITSDATFLACGLALVAVVVGLLHQHRSSEPDEI